MCVCACDVSVCACRRQRAPPPPSPRPFLFPFFLSVSLVSTHTKRDGDTNKKHGAASFFKGWARVHTGPPLWLFPRHTRHTGAHCWGPGWRRVPGSRIGSVPLILEDGGGPEESFGGRWRFVCLPSFPFSSPCNIQNHRVFPPLKQKHTQEGERGRMAGQPHTEERARLCLIFFMRRTSPQKTNKQQRKNKTVSAKKAEGIKKAAPKGVDAGGEAKQRAGRRRVGHTLRAHPPLQFSHHHPTLSYCSSDE